MTTPNTEGSGRKVVILSGIPGSGKSTWIRENLDPSLTTVISADQFFVDDSGSYEFDRDRLQEAHSDCLRRFVEAVSPEKPGEPRSGIIAVDNTNTSAWEIAPYYCLARAMGFDVRVVRFECDPLLAHARNVHGVSLEQVLKMAERMGAERLPSWWVVESVDRGSDQGCEGPEVEPGPSQPV